MTSQGTGVGSRLLTEEVERWIGITAAVGTQFLIEGAVFPHDVDDVLDLARRSADLVGDRATAGRIVSGVVLFHGSCQLGQGRCVRLADGGEQAFDHGTGVLVLGGIARVGGIGVARAVVRPGSQPFGRSDAQLAVMGEDLRRVPASRNVPDNLASCGVDDGNLIVSRVGDVETLAVLGEGQTGRIGTYQFGTVAVDRDGGGLAMRCDVDH